MTSAEEKMTTVVAIPVRGATESPSVITEEMAVLLAVTAALPAPTAERAAAPLHVTQDSVIAVRDVMRDEKSALSAAQTEGMIETSVARALHADMPPADAVTGALLPARTATDV
jgi:hypothetical protein